MSEDRFDIYTATYEEMLQRWEGSCVEVLPERRIISLRNVSGVGKFQKSDIIIIYAPDMRPAIVTERVYKRYYTRAKYAALKRSIKKEYKACKQDPFGRILLPPDFERDYIDLVSYDEQLCPTTYLKRR